MRIALAVLIALHGIIHLLGFAKAFDLAPVSQLTQAISRPVGLLWALAAILIIVSAIGYSISLSGYIWILGIMALALSQYLIITSWTDARFGSIFNIILLLIVLGQLGYWRFNRMTEKEVHSLFSEISLGAENPLSQEHIAKMPPPVKQWIQRSGALGKPQVRVARVEQYAMMKMRPTQKEWIPATAIQYTLTAEPAFHWSVNLRYNAFLDFCGRDQYKDGRGEMLILMNAFVPVVDAKGPQLDEGTLQRYLGELVWLPSLATSPYIFWEPLDSLSARATMKYKGVEGSGDFFFNAEGDFVRFVALRYQGSGPEARRYPWEIRATEYNEFNGVRVPSAMKATWQLDEGEWTWLQLRIEGLSYNAEAVP